MAQQPNQGNSQSKSESSLTSRIKNFFRGIFFWETKNKIKTATLLLGSAKDIFWLYVLNAVILTFAAIHIGDLVGKIPDQIPFFYTLPWGQNQLADSQNIWVLVSAGFIILLINLIFSTIEILKTNFQLSRFYAFLSIISTVMINVYAIRILNLVSFEEMVIPQWMTLIVFPFLAGLILVIIITPFIIRFAKKYGFMDDPLSHKHPGMLLKRPTPRAGGFAFYLAILIASLLLLPVFTSQKLIGILIAAGICVLVGLRDDKKDVSPYIRLFVQGLVILIVVMSGIILFYIPNPFGESINLDYFRITIEFLGETRNIYYYSVIAAGLWIGVTMNFMSFANGTDGVYAGLVTIASFVIAILMLDSLPEDSSIAPFVQLAAITSGAGLGMAVFTWPSQKILWGFGATSAGLIIAALSIIGSTKVATILIVLIIPFLDGMFAIVRRLRRGQLPFWGDREHLHHKLLEGLGWSKQKVAVFYWSTTLFFGIIGILTSGETRALSLLTMVIIGVLGIASINLIKKPTSANEDNDK